MDEGGRQYLTTKDDKQLDEIVVKLFCPDFDPFTEENIEAFKRNSYLTDEGWERLKGETETWELYSPKYYELEEKDFRL
jgi:hypothetical protein